ncbi:MAG: helix-turn-helix transcriptional regulator [Burkholderiaceae bacterium]|jgi:transcriptional regulator with XRE-family HTH domain|nr:helix-turn-helix transcriptional regulator [Burkholderiales bacterium]MCZ8341353.1 helix-turn-helix transcriptional regulator [Burkholderiaceae bacterium]
MDAAAPSVGAAIPSFGMALRRWRARRGLTQSAFAEACGISQRHASYVESGRSYPSRELVLRAAGVLDVPLAERNELLRLAGFAPMYGRRSIDDTDMHAVRHAIARLLDHHDPFPAVAVDAHWDVLQMNRSAQALLGALVDMPALVAERGRGPVPNVMHLTFHPRGLSRSVENWGVVGPHLFARLRQETWSQPELAELVGEVQPWVPPADPSAQRGSTLSPVLETRFLVDGERIDLFTTITSFGTAQDVLAAGIRVEHFFPADARSDALCRAFFEGATASGR